MRRRLFNLRVGTHYSPDVEYLYWIGTKDRAVQVWVPDAEYRQNPSIGLAGCRQEVSDRVSAGR
ncbi:MAG: hypothetical protein F6K28_40500 [Microcoleus sp. SIO2G3]|nr:hypothetical protein [Microcoleus sp. SIO2G3]